MNDYENAVSIIKQAVEKSRYRAAKAGNAELLSLYYGIGKYVSENTRNGTWGTDAIKKISERLKATKAFKDNYLLDFINTENLGETDEDIDGG
jgi:predicted nuclease of restriction endonuclease-like (RecB) superfamily